MLNRNCISAIRQFIAHHPLACVGTVDETGQPFSASVYVVNASELEVYFLTKTSTDKHHNLSNDQRVSLTITSEEPQTTLQLRGMAAEVLEADERALAYDAISSTTRTSNDFRLPITKIGESGYIVYKITPQSGRFTEFSDPAHGTATNILEF